MDPTRVLHNQSRACRVGVKGKIGQRDRSRAAEPSCRTESDGASRVPSSEQPPNAWVEREKGTGTRPTRLARNPQASLGREPVPFFSARRPKRNALAAGRKQGLEECRVGRPVPCRGFPGVEDRTGMVQAVAEPVQPVPELDRRPVAQDIAPANRPFAAARKVSTVVTASERRSRPESQFTEASSGVSTSLSIEI